MRLLYIVPLLLFGLAPLESCHPEDDTPAPPGDSGQPVIPAPDEDDNTMNTNLILLTVDGRSFTATLVENTATTALKQRLAQGPLTLRMDDYGGMEKVGSLGFTLPRNDVSTTTSPGDIVLYQGSSLVIFYGSNSWSYTRLGRIDGETSRERVLDLLGGTGSVDVTLSLSDSASAE